jgi:Ca2+-binding EF-hand superfamily protein
MDGLIVRLQKDVANRHLQLGQQLRQFDPNGTGLIPVQRFGRTLVNAHFTLSDAELSAIEKEFGDGRGNLNYQSFLDNVVPAARQSIQIEEILLRLQDFLLAKRVQLRPRLQKFDLRNTGNVPFMKLLALLREVGFDLTPEELAVFGAGFCHGTEELTGIDEISELVDPIIEAPKPKPVLPKLEHVEPATVVLDIMTRVAVQAEKYQLMLRDQFRVHDTRRLGTIPTAAFMAVLAGLPSPPTEQELKTLGDFYINSSNQEINYDSFCQELDEFAAVRLRQNPSLAAKILQSIPEPPAKPIEVLKRLKLALFASKTPADTLFLPYDQSSNGFVPYTKLKPILDDCGFQTSPTELDQLAAAFQDQRMPERFNYRRLCRAMDDVQLTQSDLAQAETTAPAKVTSPHVLRFASEFREKLLARHKQVRTPFAGMTALGLPTRDFRRCVESFGLVVKEGDMQMLLKEYRLNMQGDIDWRRFCSDVESNRTV